MRTVVATPRRPLLCLLAAVLAFTTLTQQGGRQPAAADHTDAPTSVTLVGTLQSELGCAGRLVAGLRRHPPDPRARRDLVGDVPGPGRQPRAEGRDRRRLGRVVRRRGRRQPAAGAGRAGPDRLHLRPGTHRVGVGPADLGGTEVTAEDRALAGDSPAGAAHPRALLLRDGRPVRQRRSDQRPGRDRRGPTGARLRPDRQGLLPRRGHRRAEQEARLHRRARHHRDLAHAELPEPPGPGLRRRGLGAATTATGSPTSPGSTRTSAPTPSSTSFIDRAHDRGIKVFFDIITNHTADVIDYAEGAVHLRRQGHRALPRRGRQRLRRPGPPRRTRSRRWTRPRRSRARPSSTRRPTAPSRCRRGSTTRRTTTTAATSTYAGESSTYGDFGGLDDLFTEQPDVVEGMTDIYKTWVDFGIDGFRIDTVKHVNLEFWQQFAPAIRDARRRHRQRRLLRLRRGLRRQPGLPVDLHHRGPPRRHPRLRLPGRRPRLRQGPADHPAAQLLRRRRPLHRHRLQRLLAADVPGQPRHGTRRRLPRRHVLRGRAAAPRRARARADVPHPRPAGRLLRRRAGLHRRRRRQGRPAGHVRQQGRVLQRRRPDRHPGHDGHAELPARAPALPHHRRAGRAARGPPRPGRRRPAAPLRQQRRRGLRVQPHRGRREPRVRRRRQQRDDREDGVVRDPRGERRVPAGVAGHPRDAARRRRGPGLR